MSPAAASFQTGKDSPSKIAEAPMPKTGTRSDHGDTVAAGYLANRNPQAPYPNSVLPRDCHSTAAQVPRSALISPVWIAGQPSKMKARTIKGGTAKALDQTTKANELTLGVAL